MINVFNYDIDLYYPDEASEMFNNIKKVLPEEDILIAIPKGCNLYLDVPIEFLYSYRQIIDDAIEERQRRNIDKNDL